MIRSDSVLSTVQSESKDHLSDSHSHLINFLHIVDSSSRGYSMVARRYNYESQFIFEW